ncbi:Spectrin repeat superfamily protein, Extracellular matrix-binding protein, putative [Babesia bigemina]|uniref:Spectrin repeat superfamily protein, Extracellular matrix-binding protein, putative n=1 Tax=Babesia bigemina TaxID=5866 RepID=A0A061DDU4_BABBI|nr:Spectrin repeat superfamily protein, Extracellular matrix-binding protein, putative [Babesia bigemina]CDR96580.1 Spectrin repeat superfamily protein, Extracellular matrix-binding protein, putative [Babesia bigemina]|eukprot:XP_012768766.1 Spectrin repeat superfamily protein, Extracellular matrix-binding protein, putative [Babesia bigemina]
MAPKKLTDCPENLREAIDWLIQVRHGGDGRGLERLSGALKQLIDEAVEKAKETMKHKRRKLECANDYYERPYCTELDEMCAKAKEKLKEFVSGKNSVSDKNALESKIKHHESNKKDCINSHDIYDRRKDEIQKEINNAEQVVAKLKKFSDRLDEYKGTDDNILNTICDGLEHFLGYNSKNYNGHGIVYGDSDRFRDAILMFLHGVLECARNNPNIKNVDAYIFILNPVIQSLYSARWNGKDGFDSAVQKVIEGVGKYFDKVKEHDALVMNPITDLIGEIDEKLDMSDYTKTLTLAEQLEQLNGSASSYNSLATDAEEALSNIDEEHKKKLEMPIQIMKQSVENFKQAAGNIDLAKQCKDVDEKLKSLPSEVNSKIEQAVAQFIKDHEKYIEHLKTGIVHDFEKRLNGWISRVDAALEATKTKGVTSIENLQSEFEKAIKALHKEIKDRVNKIDVSNLSTNVSEFKKSFSVVEEQLKKLTKDDGGKIPKGLLQSTEETIKEQLQNFVIQAHQVNDQLTNIKRSLNGWLTKNNDADGNPDGLSALSKGVNEKIESFKSEYNTIHEKLDGIKKFVEGNSDNQTLEGLISNITAQVNALDDKVAGDLNGLKTRVYAAMKAVIVDFQKGVKALADSDSGSSSAHFIQDFRIGMRDERSDAKSLVAWTKAAESGGQLRSALEQLHGIDRDFTKLRGVLEALGDFKDYSTKTFFDAITYDLKDKVAQIALALNNADAVPVKGQFSTTMVQYKNHVGRRGQKSTTTIHGVISAVSESVMSLGEAYSGTTKADGVLKELVDTLPAQMKQLTTSVEEVISKLDNNNTHLEKIVEEAKRLHKELQEDYKNGLYKKFSALREAVNVSGRQFDEVKYQLNTVLTEAKLQLEALESLPDKIKNAERTGTNALVATFTKEVMEIKIAANKLGNEKKEHCINDTKNVLDSAHRSAAGYIRQLGRQCIAAVTHAFKEITQHVQSQYASSNNAQYEALKRCVAAQKLKITTIMENDLKTGLKGFLKTVSGVAANSQTISGTGNKIAELKDMNNVKDLSVKLKAYLEQIFYYVIEQLNLNPTSGRVGSSEHSARSKSPLNDPNVSDIYTIYKIVNDVMQSLAISNSFNHAIRDKIHEAYLAIPKFVPSKFFSMPSNPLLDILKSGFDGFAKELKNVYVSKYSGATDTFNWDIFGNSEKCAKVCSTIFEILHRDLTKLKTICEGGSNAKQINLQITLDSGRKVVNPLGDFFNQRGYKVPSGASTQDAELRNETNIKGEQIKDLLYENYNIFASLHSGDDNALYDGPLEQLYNNLLDYNRVCHLRSIKNATSPHNAFQMLCWLSGLQYNPTYHPLKEYMKTFFKKAEKHKDTEYSRIPFVDLKVEATSPFSARDTVSALRLVTVQSHDILTTLLGHGHASGIYACDFNSNPGNLSYPGDSGACFDLLVEILLRLNHQLSFLYEQCCHTTKVSGWSDCWYGKGIGGSNWQCNDLKCTECTGADKCRNHPICGLKSPLQSFLEDGLKGFLPHTFTKLGCKLECSVSNHNGIPCITPMGFSDIGTVASHRQTGERIKDVLRSFCGNENSPLNQLCSYLMCLLRTPPRTLGEMFAFYYSFLHDWNDSGAHRKDGFNNAVIKANFGHSSTRFDISSMFKNTDHADNHLKGDLYSLISCSNTYIPARPCGPYMRPLCLFSRDLYSKEYSGYYLSWVVYLTETFYDLLKKLYEDCNKSCGSKGSKCYDKSCVRSCPISRDPSSSAHDPLCKSMVDCTSTLPTLCKYGFYFGSATLASGSKGDTMKRTCKEFIQQLRNVCDGNSVLAKLVNITIPQYLFTIRSPFFWTTLTLWLLSLLYLIHIMVIRLDLLHIKSHLRSPSSHRIAAQSLLAAARVNKLAKITYLQP